MIRHLLLIRHAKSDWGDASLADFDRPLNERGRRDAPTMGDRLAASGIHPDRIVSSPAKRARSTTKAIARQLGFPVHDIDWINELYLASPADILDVIRSCPAETNTLVIVSHNPGITELANHLCDAPIDNIPTCGVVHLRADCDTWSHADGFSLVDFDYPKRKR